MPKRKTVKDVAKIYDEYLLALKDKRVAITNDNRIWDFLTTIRMSIPENKRVPNTDSLLKIKKDFICLVIPAKILSLQDSDDLGKMIHQSDREVIFLQDSIQKYDSTMKNDRFREGFINDESTTKIEEIVFMFYLGYQNFV